MKFGIIANRQKVTEIRAFFGEFLTWLKDQPVEFFLEKEFSQIIDPECVHQAYELLDLVEKCDMIITLGGDGTILSTARAISFKEKPILGFHLGNLGFLAELTQTTYKQKLAQVIHGDYELDKRMVLQADISGNSSLTTYYALNDIVISKGTYPRMIRFSVNIGQNFMNSYYADGLIIATPTGSTAYSLSSSGPILTPDLNALVVNPICPHSLTNRPTVVSADTPVHITFIDISEGTHVTADGQVFQTIDKTTQITIRKAPFKVNLVRMKNCNYFEVLHTKLGWGIR